VLPAMSAAHGRPKLLDTIPADGQPDWKTGQRRQASSMDEQVRAALEQGRLIDITTIGRQSGGPRRIEIVYSRVDGDVYITGTPGRRSWYANLLANPAFTFHLKESVIADLPAHATPITDPV